MHGFGLCLWYFGNRYRHYKREERKIFGVLGSKSLLIQHNLKILVTIIAVGFGMENQINFDYQFFISSQSFKPRDSSRGLLFAHAGKAPVFLVLL